MVLPFVLLLGTMPRLSSSAAVAPMSTNSSLYQQLYFGKGCNESSFIGGAITTSLVVMKENVFCEGNANAGGLGDQVLGYAKLISSCDNAEETVTVKWHQCNTTDCSECSPETELSGIWVFPLNVWDEPTQDTCFDADLLPPYDPALNVTALSYKYANDSSIFTDILIQNSCISKSLGGVNTPSSKPASSDASGEWIGLNAWNYLVVSVGFGLLFG